MGYTELLALVLRKLLESAASKAGNQAFGWVLTFVGGDNTQQFDAIQSQLGSLEADVAAIQSAVDDIEKQLEHILAQMEWHAMIVLVTDDINDIESNFETLQQLSLQDVDEKEVLERWAVKHAQTALDKINRIALPGNGGVDPNMPGLLMAYARANAEAAVQDPNYKTNGVVNIGPGSPLDVYYSRIEQYFLYLLGVQLEGLTLLVNGFNAAGETDLAEKKAAQIMENLRAQCQIFLASVEAFAVYYAVDMTLQQILSSTAVTTTDPSVPVNPMRRASLTIDRFTSNKTFYAWMWWGSGQNSALSDSSPSTVGVTSFYTFGSNPISAQNGNLPQLVDGARVIAPDILASGDQNAYTAFPVNGQFQWAMFRFAWTNPPAGTYRIQVGSQQLTTLFVGNHPIVNLLIEPGSGRTFVNPAKTFTFGMQGTDSPLPAVYFGCTSAWFNDNPCYGGTTSVGIYSLPGDFSVEGWFYVTDRHNPVQTLLSNKCAYGGGPQVDPGSTGFMLTYDWNDHLAVTVDNGQAYYQVMSGQTGHVMDDKWHHIAAVRKNWLLSIYLDGQLLQVTTNKSGDPSTMRLTDCWNITFGCKNGNTDKSSWPSFKPTEQYTGYMNEVAVWGKALTQAEINTHMTQGFSAKSSGLLGYWPFTYGTYDDVAGSAKVQNPRYHLALRNLPVCYPPVAGAAASEAQPRIEAAE